MSPFSAAHMSATMQCKIPVLSRVAKGVIFHPRPLSPPEPSTLMYTLGKPESPSCYHAMHVPSL